MSGTVTAEAARAKNLMLWTDPDGLRIWRAPTSDLTRDELRNAAVCYSDDMLARVADEGFTAIWLFGVLYDLMRSSVFPELNRPGADERVASIRQVAERARRHGLGVYLYFNEPVSVAVDHPFWRTHRDVQGAEKWNTYALCTSTPAVQAFFRDALESVFARLHGIDGVILITACESLTHCWSKSATRHGQPPTACPRCREREPADLVLELLRTWIAVSRAQPRPFRVIAWNWEWAYWYPDPQRPIVSRLPEGIELLLDMEIGAVRQWRGRPNPIGEYALCYTGPSERFVATQDEVAGRNIPVHAKIQLNVTHELCTVPNVPVLATIHGKLAALAARRAAGFMGTWSMGSSFTLNTRAQRLFRSDPARFADEGEFLAALAREYLGVREPARVVRAWSDFSRAYAHYPFSVRLLYNGPHNDAPGRRLSLRYEGTPAGRSFAADPPGDDLSLCAGEDHGRAQSFTLDEIIGGYERMSEGWDAALPPYEAALLEEGGAIGEEQRRHRAEELSTARMVGLQLHSIVNVFRFYREQQRLMRALGLAAPCRLPPDPALLAIMAAELENARRALPLVVADRRLGFHQEFHGYKYSAETVRAKIEAMSAELAAIHSR